MPGRSQVRQKTVGKTRGASQKSAAYRPRKINFDKEPWYAATARRMSASRSAPEPFLEETASPPLASE
jgi:hypothetical protein